MHDLGLAPDGRPYFTMKLLDGETLEGILARLRRGDFATIAKYPLPALLEIFTRVCEAVAFAHSRGVIHRDIKPANVQVGDYGEVRLIDWGLAKSSGDPTDLVDRPDPSDAGVMATCAGTVKGTPGYMAPEQAAGRGNEADVRTDTYALGALLYALLIWQPPVNGSSTTELLCRTVAGEIIPPRQRAPKRFIPSALDAIACKALATDPARRYPTADSLLADLLAFTNGYATSAETAGPLRLLWLVIRRHGALSLAIVVSLLILAGVGLVSVQRIRASRDETRAALNSLQEEQALRTRLTCAAVPKILAEARAQIRALAYDDALETLRAAIGVDPAQTEVWDLAGWIYFGREQYDLAAAAFRHELETIAAPSWKGKTVRTREALVDTARTDTGLLLATRAAQSSRDAHRPLAPDEFRQLVEQVRLVENRRLAMGVYCSRHNPAEWSRATHAAFVQWALRALNSGKAELDLHAGDGGPEARVIGAADLLPLAGLPLVALSVRDTAVRDLQPLRGMPLRRLDISNTPVATFEPLYALPLRELDAEGFKKLPADLFARCPTLETVVISAGTELSRQNATWPASVRVIRK